MQKRFIILGSLVLSLTFLNSCEKEKEETGTTTSSTTASTVSTTSGNTSASTSVSTTTTGTTSSTITSSTTTTTGLACAPTSSEVVIGTQAWTTINLNVDKFRNGDIIPEAKTDDEWEAANTNKTPAWSYYSNSVDSGAIYSKLYNWYAVNDSRGLAPTGWHIPSDAEWTTLTTYLGGLSETGLKMKNTCGWIDGGNGSNTSGFAGLPSGFRGKSGTFHNIKYYGEWWSSTEDDTDYAYYRYLRSSNTNVGRSNYIKGSGLSVRCLRD
jgi:uncharacterized protein (TIGR02145 family)